MSCGRRDWTPKELGTFEHHIADLFLAKEIRAPIHLSGGNEKELLHIFKRIAPEDWVLSTHRSHYHALLHGISPDWVEAEILAGRSMHLNSPAHRFLTSAIIGGIAPIAVGIAMGLHRAGRPEQVWCFLGDMAWNMGLVHEARKYAEGHGLEGLHFVLEDNGLSADTPTWHVWGSNNGKNLLRAEDLAYDYKREWPHVGVGRFVHF